MTALRVYKNRENYIVEVPAALKDSIAGLMAYRGLQFSMSASNKERAILFSPNPYSVCDIPGAELVPELAPYMGRIKASRVS